MFKLGQILTTTKFIRNFHRILKELEGCPQPVLITQRNGCHMVLVNAEIFEDLTISSMRKDGLDVSPSHIRTEIELCPKAY